MRRFWRQSGSREGGTPGSVNPLALTMDQSGSPFPLKLEPLWMGGTRLA